MTQKGTGFRGTEAVHMTRTALSETEINSQGFHDLLAAKGRDLEARVAIAQERTDGKSP